MQEAHVELKSTNMNLSYLKNVLFFQFCVHADKRAMLQELTASLLQSPSESRVLVELARCISSAVSADGHVLYVGNRASELKVCYDAARR